MPKCTLHLGSNRGNRFENIESACLLIEEKVGSICNKSEIYLTYAWGKEDQNDFLNLALIVETELLPTDLLFEINHIENQLGRIRHEKWGPRIIDIDIIFYDQKIIENDDLIIPHPEITNRNFVLKPLLDLCPDFIHPTKEKTVQQLFEESLDSCQVRKWEK